MVACETALFAMTPFRRGADVAQSALRQVMERGDQVVAPAREHEERI